MSEIAGGPVQERAALPLEDKTEGIREALVAAMESQRSGWSISDPRSFFDETQRDRERKAKKAKKGSFYREWKILQLLRSETVESFWTLSGFRERLCLFMSAT